MSVLLFAPTTGYQLQSFEAAARALGLPLVLATDRCDQLGDAWGDRALPVSFADPAASAREVVAALPDRRIAGVLGLGDRAAVLTAHAAALLGLPWHSPDGARAAMHKLLARGRFVAAGLPVPWFTALELGQPLDSVVERIRFPCVVKPAVLSGSRGVMRADDVGGLERALQRLEQVLSAHDLKSVGDPDLGMVVVEGFVPGHEYALEGVMTDGTLHVLAIFDKPDPLDGPYFEEGMYVTPPMLAEPAQRAMAGTIAHAALALGLGHGPVHAECRVNEHGVFVLEVAARPIGGLCANALRFISPAGVPLGLEELLLRHARGEPLDGYARERDASGVMMIPVPGRGRFREVTGLDEAARVHGVEQVLMTAKPGELLEPWPEGHSYPGFIFARADLPEQVVSALRAAHQRLAFQLDTVLPLA